MLTYADVCLLLGKQVTEYLLALDVVRCRQGRVKCDCVKPIGVEATPASATQHTSAYVSIRQHTPSKCDCVQGLQLLLLLPVLLLCQLWER